MVNRDFNKFIKVATKHSTFKEEGKKQQKVINDEDYNNQSNTDKSVGATGREQ